MKIKILSVFTVLTLINCEKHPGSFSITIKHDSPKKQYSSHSAPVSSSAHSEPFSILSQSKTLSHSSFDNHREPAPIYEKQSEEKKIQQRGPFIKPIGNTQQIISNGFELESQIAQSVKQQTSASFNLAKFGIKNQNEQIKKNNKHETLGFQRTDFALVKDDRQIDKKEQTVSFKNVVLHKSEDKRNQKLDQDFSKFSSYLQPSHTQMSNDEFKQYQETQDKNHKNEGYHYDHKKDHDTLSIAEISTHEGGSYKAPSYEFLQNKHDGSLFHSPSISSYSNEYSHKPTHNTDSHHQFFSSNGKSHGSSHLNNHAYSSQSFILHTSDHNNKAENNKENNYNDFHERDSSHGQENSQKSHKELTDYSKKDKIDEIFRKESPKTSFIHHNDSDQDKQSYYFSNHFSKNDAKIEDKDISSHENYDHGTSNSESESSFSSGFGDLESSNHNDDSSHHGHLLTSKNSEYHNDVPDSKIQHESSNHQQGSSEHIFSLKNSGRVFEYEESASDRDHDTFSDNSGYHYQIPELKLDEISSEHKQDLDEHSHTLSSENSQHDHEYEHHDFSKHGPKVSTQNSGYHYHVPHFTTHKYQYSSEHEQGSNKLNHKLSSDNSDKHHHTSESNFKNGNDLSLGNSGYHYIVPEHPQHESYSKQDQTSSDFSGYHYDAPVSHHQSSSQTQSSAHVGHGSDHKHQYETYHILSGHKGSTTNNGHDFSAGNFFYYPNVHKTHQQSSKNGQESSKHAPEFSFLPKYESHHDFFGQQESSSGYNLGISSESHNYHTPKQEEHFAHVGSSFQHGYDFGSAKGHEKSFNVDHVFSPKNLDHGYQAAQSENYHEPSDLTLYDHTSATQIVDHSNEDPHHYFEFQSASNQNGHHESHSQYYYVYPKYEYSYVVKEPQSLDLKTKQEVRDAIHDTNGSIRSVEYYADKHNGLNAQVKKSGQTYDDHQSRHH